MGRTSRFVPVLIVLVAGGFLFGYFDVNSRERAEQVVFQHPPTPQAGKRIFRDVVAEEVVTLGGSEDYSFRLPFLVEVGADEEIYVLDAGRKTIEKFNGQGDFVGRFGQYPPRGSGRIIFPTDFHVDEDGGVVVTDLAQKSLISFDSNGVLGKVVKLDQAPLRLLGLPDGGFLVQLHRPKKGLFGRLSPEFTLVESFGSLIESQASNGVALEGWLAGDKRGIVYAPAYIGLVASYSAEGIERFVVETIDPVDPPRVTVDRDGFRRVDKDSPRSAYGVGIWQDNIYVVATRDHGRGHRDLVDFYGRSNGEYLFSVDLPGRCRFAFLRGEALFTVGETTVTKWSVDFVPQVDG